MAPLTCFYCGKRILRSKDDFDEQVLVQGHSSIEKAWHVRCAPSSVPADTPWQSAVGKLKQAVADAKRLDSEGELAFWEVFDRVRGQRD